MNEAMPMYNNYYTPQNRLWAANNPYNYTPSTYQLQPQPQPQVQQRVDSGRIWVQGEGSAKAYIVANNSEQVLWDSDQPAIYIKTVDQNGKPSLTILDYTIRETKQEPDTGKENEELKNEIAELKMMVKQLIQQKPYTINKTYNKKGDTE